jgi:phage terminase small subunit
MENKQKLTSKQQLFVEYFVGEASGNASLAARLAGYKGNDVTLGAVGAENLQKPQIAALCQKRVEDAAMSANDVLKHITDIALATNESARDRLTALQLLGKYHQLFTDNLNIKSNGKNLNFAALLVMANQAEK